MQFNEEHITLMNTVRDFAVNEIHPNIEEWERSGIFPAHSLFKKLGSLDLLGITKSKEFGGMGLDYSYGLAFAEALGHAWDLGVITAIGVHTDMATPAIDRFGSSELKEEFLSPAINGEYIGALAVSEVGGGSDVAALKTSARKDGDDYIIDGQKMWITNAKQADFFCTLVNTSNEDPHNNKSLIVIPASAKGLTVGDKIEKLGQHTSDTAPVYFDNVRVPQRYCIGDEGKGFKIQMQQFQEERMFLSASVLIVLEQCIAKTIEYCQDRHAFGKAIIENQSIQFRLAELQTEVEALRALIYRAAEDFILGKDMTYLASMAKLKSGRLTREVSDACLQYWGGMGFSWENPASKVYRDGRVASIAGGTDEVMLQIICKKMEIA
ncbi:MAG: acyl-CoA dehydrogenase family protein [Candidatus Neomarinimicrobiota bacterium]|nr:acyl-CoA dehydrogenase family protein [Candidatus Neomarinimicrobiota bacterium]